MLRRHRAREGSGGHWGGRKLTLDTSEKTARSEEDGGKLIDAAELRSVTVKKNSIRPIHGLPASVSRRGSRGGRGGVSSVRTSKGGKESKGLEKKFVGSQEQRHMEGGSESH